MSITLTAVIFRLIVCMILAVLVLIILAVLIILVIVIIVLHSGHLLLYYAERVRTIIMSETKLSIL